MTAEEYIKKQTKKMSKTLFEKYGLEYLDICFMCETIMVSNTKDIKVSSKDWGETWNKR